MKRQGQFVVPLSVVDFANKLIRLFLEFGCVIKQFAEKLVERVYLFALECNVLCHFDRNVKSRILERFSCFGDLNVENSLVFL